VLVIGAENLPSAMYTPLVILLAVYAALSIMAGRARSREDRERADRWANIAFGVVLVSALYALVLLISALVGYPSRSSDMLIIIVEIVIFFALLLFVFFVIAELIPQALRRGRGER
jgi:Na+-driven multidrug efflux pump